MEMELRYSRGSYRGYVGIKSPLPASNQKVKCKSQPKLEPKALSGFCEFRLKLWAQALRLWVSCSHCGVPVQSECLVG